jgi:hypothetical protein
MFIIIILVPNESSQPRGKALEVSKSGGSPVSRADNHSWGMRCTFPDDGNLFIVSLVRPVRSPHVALVWG